MASKRLVCLSCAARARSNPCSSGWSETLDDRLAGAVTSRGSPPQLYHARTALIPSAMDPSGLRDREWDLTIARSSSCVHHVRIIRATAVIGVSFQYAGGWAARKPVWIESQLRTRKTCRVGERSW